MKKIILLYIVIICTAAGYSQERELKRANKLFDEYAFPEAAEAYRDYLKKENKPGKETVRKIADTYYNIGDYGSAVTWYAKLEGMPGYTMDDKYFNRYMQSLLMDGNVKKNYAAKADELITKRLSAQKDKSLLTKYMAAKKSLDSVNATPNPYTITNIQANSSKADFGTTFYGNKVVYASSKDVDKVGRKIYKWNEQPMLELFVADRDIATGELINEEKFFPKELNNYHNATLAFTSDLRTVYFSTNAVKESGFRDDAANGTNNIQLIKATIEDNKLVNEEKLKINKLTYSVAHPALTPDGKWMLFTSDMPGGFGETDIYVAKVLENGELDDVTNLGPEINTVGKEMFPFVSGNVLYFSSDGRYGMGGLDVFRTTMSEDMKFSQPRNLGMHVNSNRDDFAYIISDDGNYGYFSSNRKKGKGDDDIYYFTKKPDCKQLLAGNVIREDKPVAGAIVTIYNSAGVVITKITTGEDGRYSFEADCGSKVVVEVAKPEFSTVTKEFEVTNLNPKGNELDLTLVKLDDVVRQEGDRVVIDINPIYFDLDKYDITPKAEVELNKVVDVMMNFPSVVIKIESHTDSRQTHKYNEALSANRAKATYDYLIAKGINETRIDSYKGYGETRLLNGCSDDVPCSEEEHQLNRRSDFVIVRR